MALFLPFPPRHPIYPSTGPSRAELSRLQRWSGQFFVRLWLWRAALQGTVTVRNTSGFEREPEHSPNAVTSTWSDDTELYIRSCGPGQQSWKSDDTMSDSDRCWRRSSFVRGNGSASCEAPTVRGWSKSGRSQVSSNGAMWGALFRKAAR